MDALGDTASTPREEQRSDGLQRPARRTGMILLLSAGAALAGAGLLLWSRQADAVFGQYLLGALAWCF